MDVMLIYLGVTALIACALGYLQLEGGFVIAILWPVLVPFALLLVIPLAAFGFGSWLKNKGSKA